MKHFFAIFSMLFSLVLFFCVNNTVWASSVPIGVIIRRNITGVTCVSNHPNAFKIEPFIGSISTPFFFPTEAKVIGKASYGKYFLGLYNPIKENSCDTQNKENYPAYPFTIFGSN